MYFCSRLNNKSDCGEYLTTPNYMKKVLFVLSMTLGTLAIYADGYPYLTFETADGTKMSVSSTSLTITIQDGKLLVGSKEFTLAELSKMYFSTSDETATGVEEVSTTTLDDTAIIYDLQGRKVSRTQMLRGIYVIKTKNGTRKINVK